MAPSRADKGGLSLAQRSCSSGFFCSDRGLSRGCAGTGQEHAFLSRSPGTPSRWHRLGPIRVGSQWPSARVLAAFSARIAPDSGCGATATEDELGAEMAGARTQAVKSFQRKRPTRKPFPNHLPRERVVLAAPESCPCCGSYGRTRSAAESQHLRICGPPPRSSSRQSARIAYRKRGNGGRAKPTHLHWKNSSGFTHPFPSRATSTCYLNLTLSFFFRMMSLRIAASL